jgi:Family of unknown function (DUF6459)
MQQNPPPPPGPAPDLPAGPAVVPILPTRVRQPGRQAPLPDAVAVRRLRVPDPAPPFDDEIRGLATEDTAGNGLVISPAPRPRSGDLAESGPADSGPAESGPAESGPAESGPAESGPAESGRQRQGGGPTPDSSGSRRLGAPRRDPAGDWPSRFAQVLSETLAGSRPAQQLTPWTTEQALKRIRQLGPLLATDQRPKVRRVLTSAPAAGVIELTAVVGFGPRFRALALRLELEQSKPPRPGGDRWCCTAIESA